MMRLLPKWYSELSEAILKCPKCKEKGHPVEPFNESYGQVKWNCKHLKHMALNVG